MNSPTKLKYGQNNNWIDISQAKQYEWSVTAQTGAQHVLSSRKCKLKLLCDITTCPAAAAAKSLQSCPTLCDPTDGSPPGSPIPGILQARALEWGAIAFSYYMP